MGIDEFSQGLRELLAKNPDFINDFNSVMTSIREMVGPLRELKNLNEFQVKIKERLEQQLPPLYAGIKTGNIFKTLYTIQKELNELKAAMPLVHNIESWKTAMIEGKDVFKQESINSHAIMVDWTRDLHLYSIKNLEGDSLLTHPGVVGEVPDQPVRCGKVLQAFEAIAKECGELDDFKEIFGYAKKLLRQCAGTKQDIKQVIEKALDDMIAKKRDSKTIKALRSMTQGNTF